MLTAVVLICMLVLLAHFCLRIWCKYLPLLQLSRELKGPPALPIIGNGAEFINKEPSEYFSLLIKWAAMYGDIFRIWMGPMLAVIVTNPTSIEEILGSTDFVTKADEYKLLEPWLQEGLLLSTGRKWHTRRKIITPTFHFNILKQYIEVFDENSSILVSQLRKLQQMDCVNMESFISKCSLDIICETTMGTSCQAQTNAESPYVNAINTISMVLQKRLLNLKYRFGALFSLTELARVQKKALKVVHDFTHGVIVARREELLRLQQENSNQDGMENKSGAQKEMPFLDMLLQAQVDEKPLSNREIQEEVDTFMFEGHDTTTSAITFCLYSLARHPEVQKKCYDEICKIIGRDENKPISHSDLNNLSYLGLVFKESLRLFPSVPCIGRKAKEECTINGTRIPAGTSIAIPVILVGRNENVFPQADKFIPERFDPTSTTACENLNPYSYIPFSAGPRNCIGQKFAVLEAKSVISKILRHFELEMTSNQDEPILVQELTLKSNNPMYFKLTPRIS